MAQSDTEGGDSDGETLPDDDDLSDVVGIFRCF